ncbi:MAG: SGNH/GDSL hydrolase family protein [Deltaproteobacteria bacterium]|nr:SGNH/GDSL hydrolase family protein [Deltaproteobacteria bacterium]
MRARRWIVELVLAAIVMLLGLQLPFADSARIAAIALPLILGGAVWVVSALLRRGPDGALPSLRRRQIALAFSASLVALVLALVVATRIRARAVHFVGASGTARPQQADGEIGWAPGAPAGTVGARLDVADPTRPQILLIGDSIVYGQGVDASETVSSALQRARPGDQILNAAVSGYSIDQYFLYLRRILPQLNPKVIVVGLFSGNDFQLTAREMTWGKGKPLYAVEHGRLERVGTASGCIDRLAGSLLFRAFWREPHAANDLLTKMCGPCALRRGETEALIGKLFDEIDALAVARNVPVLWLMLPLKYEHSVHEETRYLHYARYHDLMRILRERPRQIFDFSLDVSPRHAELDQLYLSDNAHFSPKGHALLAAALDREIRARFPQLGDGSKPR